MNECVGEAEDFEKAKLPELMAKSHH